MNEWNVAYQWLCSIRLVWWSQSRRLLRRRVWPDRRRSYPPRKPLHFTRTAHHEIAHRIRHTTVLYLQLQLALTGSNPTSAYVRRRLWHRLGHRRSIAHWYFALKSSASIRRLPSFVGNYAQHYELYIVSRRLFFSPLSRKRPGIKWSTLMLRHPKPSDPLRANTPMRLCRPAAPVLL